jgi:HD-GYP domain-containing protein (c-di-GMP phosphodiesterase class II)
VRANIEPAVRLGELVATLSYAADLGLGQPLAHCMRKTVIALRMADLVGATPADREATFYTGLLANAYCHADAAEQASWFGDDIGFKAGSFEALDMSTMQAVATLLRFTAGQGRARDRMRRVAGLPAMRKRVGDFLTTHSTLASAFATEVGLDPAVTTAIWHTYEQWDGSGLPEQLRAEQISLPARLVHLAGPVEVFARRSVDAARSVARRHRATQYDPALVDLFCANASELLDGLDQASEWQAFLDTQPTLVHCVSGDELDRVLQAMADLVDLKSPYFSGHSRGVAALVAAAAATVGLPAGEITELRRAAWLHDLGRLGVSNAILDKPGPLSSAERERARLHPYLTDRMLAGLAPLQTSRRIAGRHHERLDGSGYPSGLGAAVLTAADRLLAAADTYHAMTEPRAYREPIQAERAAELLRAEVKAGRLDGDAVTAVLTAAGHRAPVRRTYPRSLTEREVEVLSLLARGYTNRQIATRLAVSAKTVSNHVEHIYAKLELSSRAAATLFASRHGLVGAFETDRPSP